MIAPARRAAFEALLAIARGRVDLADALAHARESLADARDRALVHDMVTGTLRWQGTLDVYLAARVAKPLARLDPEVRTALRLGAYQLVYLTRVPAAAVVNDMVALTRRAHKTSAAGMVNAVLRRLADPAARAPLPPPPGDPDAPASRDAAVAHLAATGSHPAWLVARWLDREGFAATGRWLAFDNEPAALTLRPNRLRASREALAEALAREGVRTHPTAIAPDGLVVDEGKALASTAFTSGACLVQDGASQLIPDLLGVEPGHAVLDLCAAPGGKTVALAAAAGSGGRVVACDVRPRRVALLRETLARCGVTNARVVHVDTEAALPFGAVFDRVLVDAPCSGLGTVRRDPDIRWRRQPEDLPLLAAAQQRLLTRAAAGVRPGGRVLYRTCSSEPDENADVIRAFLGTHPDFRLVPLQAQALPPSVAALVDAEGWLRTSPPRDRLEAFFAALVERAIP